jgi:hypothetical protein
MIDGLPVSGSEFARRANSGSLNVVFSGAISGVIPLIPLGLGIFGYDRPTGWHSDKEGGVDLQWRGEIFTSSGKNRRHGHHPIGNPQDTLVGPEDREAYKARIASMLKDKTCADFIKELLNEAKTLTGRSYNDILGTFDTIKFYWKDEPPWYGGHAFFEHGKPVATINEIVKTEKFINEGRSEYLIRATTYSFFGETLHHVGVGSMYGDGVMAQALNNILVRKGKADPQTFDLRDIDQKEIDRASGYWHPRVEHFCRAPRK